MTKDANYWIRLLDLQRHVEGGAFKEIYRSPVIIDKGSLPHSFSSPKSISTSIYFLLESHQCSLFHRIKSDEIWHFYTGDALLIHEIFPSGQLRTHRLGANPDNNESFQTVIQAGNWFASHVAPGGSYTLAGCTVSPGFDFEDFAIADRNDLIQQYPEHAALIHSLTPAP
jgi:predicted cupin superfamily sugar epimerase